MDGVKLIEAAAGSDHAGENLVDSLRGCGTGQQKKK